MRVGVTGGAGFIGQWVCRELWRRGHEPVTFDRVAGRADFLGDVRDATAVHELAAHVDGIIHLAAVLGTQETAHLPGPAVDTNVGGAVNVMEACRANSVPVVNICVGNHWMLNSYSTTKTCAERLFEQFRRECGLRVNQVRVVNAYGPGQSVARPYGSAKVRKIVPSFAVRALCGDDIEVYGDGQQVSDCVFVGDVARVLVSALTAAGLGRVFDQVIEVGPVTHSTVLDVAHLVREAAGSDSRIVHLPMRPGEEPGARVTADVSTLSLVGEDPAGFKSLECGIGETVSWFREVESSWWRR